MAAGEKTGQNDLDVVEVTSETHPRVTDEKKAPQDEKRTSDIEIASASDNVVDSDFDDAAKIYVPDENDDVIDPRLKDYPVPLVAKTVSLHNDFDEPILTFRFWFLSTFWVVVGCGVSSMYYFKPYTTTLTSYAVQLLSWGMGDFMAKWLPKRKFTVFGRSFSFNPGPWNAKEHSLIVVAYWGSCYTAYGLGPLSAMELYYGRRINAGWGILFLLTTQMIGYGFAGIFRDILVRPPKIYYPGVLPNVALFNAMHHNPSVTKKSLRFFSYVAVATFIWQWFPGFVFPMLSSLPLVCYFAHGQWRGFIMGSGTYGFGMLDISLDWNYAAFWQPLYTPLWANASQIGGAAIAVWLIYPIMYFTNTLNAINYPPMSSGTFDDQGQKYNISRILTPQYTLNQTAMDEYSLPHWSVSYAMYFFWGFACSTGAIVYSALWYGKDSWVAVSESWKGRRSDYNDPYLKLMSRTPRVPHWWYLSLLAASLALSLGCLYGAGIGLPWWGFILTCIVSVICTFPNGILWGVANMQVGMAFISELMAGGLFPGDPAAVLACMTYGRQILEQNLNLISDYKFGFYMKVPEREMFWAQVYGTLLGPFVNYGVMRLIIDYIGADTLKGIIKNPGWLALKTRNYYSISVLWGILGPKVFFSSGSEYAWMYWAFLLGPALVVIVYVVHRFKPEWELETRCNPVVIMYGAVSFPVYQSVNLFTSGALALFFMGYMLRYHGAWFRKYNYLLGVGLDCGSQIAATVVMFGINLPAASMPFWWGNDELAVDRCFPPMDLPPNALN
ncbi:oligopeptide transporter 6 [Lasiosphaeria hispida]|uniref:Oligopeptide transporter 6 n=1 Tax=Lasiosphaeria hispida TaxID=260671 RepID=A0AAJ0MBA8_9PEZI|nr:oligopeptide transporter 6 [Lasiosphaeria hispida]